MASALNERCASDFCDAPPRCEECHNPADEGETLTHFAADPDLGYCACCVPAIVRLLLADGQSTAVAS